MNRELLEQPFEDKCILQRRGNYGQMLSYIPAHLIIQRLNDSTDGNWSFEVAEYQQMGEEVVVLGKLTTDGVTKMQFGNSRVTMGKSGEVVSIGDDIKAATSDCIKKCATPLGVGLHLYGDTTTHDSAAQTDMSTMSGNHGSNLITGQQLAQVKSIRTNLGWTPEDVQDHADRLFSTRDVAALNSTMGSALIAYLQNQGNGSR